MTPRIPYKFGRMILLIGLMMLPACAGGGAEHVQRIDTTCSQGASSCNVVGGFAGNDVGENLAGGTIGGGGERGAPNRLTGSFGTIGGGEGNVAGEGSTVAGGSNNTAINFNAAVGGGSNNLASAHEAVVAGGLKNTASERFSTVGGGASNVASDINTTVAGGSGNTASFTFAAVCGGTQNEASNTAALVGGGDHNVAQGAYGAILGGLNNSAAGYLSSIGGGAGNTATGSYASVPGGFANAARGDYSFAAGRTAQVQAPHSGTFLFADGSPLPFESAAANEFAVRATGGVRLVTAIDQSGAQLAGVRLSAGSGSWETLSDSNSKADFQSVDEQAILDNLASMPIRSWRYKGENAQVRHLGPTAQDFHAAFGLGEDVQYISTADADGVALAAVQQLYRLVSSNGTVATAATVESLRRQLVFSNVLAMLSCAIAVAAWWKRSTKQSALAGPSR
jgi:trimeric autotransporter adhesin